MDVMTERDFNNDFFFVKLIKTIFRVFNFEFGIIKRNLLNIFYF